MKKSLKVLIFSALLVVAFENCGKMQFSTIEADQAQKNSADIENNNLEEVGSYQDYHYSPPAPSSPPASSYETDQQGQTYAAFSGGFNFVAGDARTCDQSIVSRLGISSFHCTYGGGCAVHGGSPTGSNPSANPHLPGACIGMRIPAKPSDPVQKTYNFVAADKSACDLSIMRRLGRVPVSCSMGGGCSVDGRVPTAAHPSANPQHYGACVEVSFN